MSVAQSISSQELTGLDLTKVAALQQKRTVAFVNHFVTTTVQFLNGFMKKCEDKLMRFERQLEKVEASMVLLESRLSSIPEVNTVQPEIKPESSSGSEVVPPSESEQKEQTDIPEPEKTNTSEPSHPEYDRFIKMVSVGVPLQAVKLKVSLEGLDPDILEKLVNKFK